jgi:hypothetical protein
MMLLRGPQSLTRHPSLDEPAGEISLRVVAVALGRKASQAIAEHQRLVRRSEGVRELQLRHEGWEIVMDAADF